eukprot:jgi/Ulvmu1/7655/UM038_0084.1
MQRIQDGVMSMPLHRSRQQSRRQGGQPQQSCALSRLLARELPGQPPQPSDLEEMRSLLSIWGNEQPDFVLLMKHHHALEQQRELRAGMRQGKHTVQHTSSQSRKGDTDRTGPIDWAALQPVSLSGLELFGVAKGKKLEGLTIVPPVCSVGMATILRDLDGRVVRVALYNQAPGGRTALHAAPFLTEKFPQGTRIAIAEPFFKVAMDGCLTIRVDSPAEVQVGHSRPAAAPAQQPHSSPCSSAPALTAAAARLRQHLHDGEIDLVVQGATDVLRSPSAAVSLACVLLSNRAQALLRAGHAAAALRDAAAALTIQPQQPKAWMRYAAALRALDAGNIADRADLVAREGHIGAAGGVAPDQDGAPAEASDWRQALKHARVTHPVRTAVCVPAPAAVPATTGDGAELLKARGNERYQSGEFAGAAECYTRALLVVPGIDALAAVLAMLAKVCLSTGSRHSAAAAAAACVRMLHVDGEAHKQVGPAVKWLAQALLGLGEHETCAEMLTARSSAAGCLRGSVRRELLRYAGIHAKLLQDTAGLSALQHLPKELYPDVVKHASLVKIPGKGRGLRADRSLPPHTIVAINSALVWAQHDVRRGILFSRDATSISDASSVALCAKAVQAASQEPLIAHTLLSLDDNPPRAPPTRELPLVELQEMQQQLSCIWVLE